MKKSMLVVICLLCFIVLPAIVLPNFYFNRPFAGTVAVTGQPTDNAHNNLAAGGHLVRVGNTLYYSTGQRESNSVYSISDKGTKRIYNKKIFTDDFYFTAGLPYCPLLLAEENAFYNISQGYVEKYFLSEAIFTPVEIDPYLFLTKQSIAAYKDTLFFIKEIEEQTYLCSYVNGKVTMVKSIDNLCGLYRAGDTLYLLAETDILHRFYSYSLTDGKLTEIVLFSGGDSVTSFMVNGNTLYMLMQYGAGNGLYCLDFNPDTLTIRLPGLIQAPINNFNFANGLLYLATDDGVFTFDPIHFKRVMLCDSPAVSCTILDDTWVYFEGEDGTLWRIQRQGKAPQQPQKVFGR